jgi:hypothetical protein
MILTLFQSVQKAYTRPEWVIDTTWEEAAKFLTTWQNYPTKESAELFNLWQFDMEGEPFRRRIYESYQPTEKFEILTGTIRRCKANAKLCYGLVLDYDGKTNIDEAIKLSSNYSFALYTTFRHTEEIHKFRVVIPFSRAVTSKELHAKEKAIQSIFKDVDHASFSESQSFYLHSGVNKFTYINKGVFLDPDWFEDEVIVSAPSIVRTEYTGDRNIYREMMIDSLTTCSGLHYNNEASKYGVLVLVGLCKSADISYNDYNTICWNMAAPDSSLQDEKFRKSAWYGWNSNKITAKVREGFISAYGGTSKFNRLQESALTKRLTAMKIKLKERGK